MDDLTVLRDLGRDLEHEPPATLALQRGRLLDTATGTVPRRRLFGHMRAGGGRRPLSGVTRGKAGWVMLAAVAAVTALLVVVPTVLLRAAPTVRTVASPNWERPQKQGGALNVLLLGTDRRPPTGATSDMGERSDTMMLLHVPADGKKVTVVSLPRDSMVKIPSCTTPDGTVTRAKLDMINSAYYVGGLVCAWKTVESVTGLRVDHVVAMHFEGFKDMVNALGGVEVVLPEAVDDPQAKFKLPAGRHVLNGEQALGYARVRHALGDGSDIGRIKRQQVLMKVMLRKVAGSLDDPARLTRLLGAARKWVTTDDGLDLGTMVSIAQAVLKAKADVRFVSVPWEPYVADRKRLQWRQPETSQLFDALKRD